MTINAAMASSSPQLARSQDDCTLDGGVDAAGATERVCAVAI
jgi:hypothetical protein